MQLIKKIGSKQVLGNVAALIKEIFNPETSKDGDVVRAYTVIGIASSIKTGAGTYGEWLAFVGQFEATNLITGEVFGATQAFVQEPLSTIFANALRESDSPIEFAFAVSLKRRDDLERGYEYTVEPIVTTQKADPLAHLKQAANALIGHTLVPEITLEADTTETKKGKKA